MTGPKYEVYAVRYARHDERRSSEVFLGGDPHDRAMPLDYFVWAIRGPKSVWVVDTGFTAERAVQRKRTFLRCPSAGLRAIGIDANEVENVIITHMHYDHVGNHHLFPKAVYHIQDREMAYATSRHMCNDNLRGGYEAEDVAEMVYRLYAGRLRYHAGDEMLEPGLSVHHIGGHTDGQMAVRIRTRRGWLVLASDSAHFYANFIENRPFAYIFHVGDTLEGFRKLRSLAESEDMVIPGHDPLVMQRHPPAGPGLEGIAVRLD
ncbi:MAG: N-acyl homoserine lactonase family protein [Alphaproteobacteria bacterium]|nr:N-acyl homoserine lactonase family protein [Alphaproteobacteria bacterium]